MNIRPKHVKPRVTLAQAQAWERLTGAFRPAEDIGACETSLLALVTKGLAEHKAQSGGPRLYRRKGDV